MREESQFTFHTTIEERHTYEGQYKLCIFCCYLVGLEGLERVRGDLEDESFEGSGKARKGWELG